MSGRDRFGAFPADMNLSQLQRFIQRACDPSNYEPNLALNLEIADLVNQKKGNAPREAAITIVNLINNRNPNVSLLALALLDICVKNCGYPFHLQISTKDFLNELVRRFPERPPMRPNRVQMKILEAIEEWRGTICETSRYKEDLGFIRDMHRLLSYKGYQFPEVRREDAAVLNPSDNLKSAEEMEEEERAAQSAKLQELIRRGTPADLQEANHLMKIMTGYDTRNKTDYRAEAAKELAKLKQKARLLEEHLLKVKRGETIGQQDVYSELASALITAQPKIQRMVEEEHEDHEAVVKLLELNDLINTTIERYNLVKKGDFSGAAALPVQATSAPAPSSSTTEKASRQEMTLIDLDNDANGSTAGTQGERTSTSLEDDLLGLSFGAPAPSSSSSSSGAFGIGGGIALGFGANTSIPGPPLLSSTMHENTAGRQQITPSASPMPQKTAPPYYNALFNLSGSHAPVPGTGSGPVQPPKMNFPPMSGLDIISSQKQPARSEGSSNEKQNNDADEWADFASALPPSSEPPVLAANEVLVLSSNLYIVVEASRRPEGSFGLRAKFSNASAVAIYDLEFQMAVPRAYNLRMEPQSSRFLPVGQKDAVTQMIYVTSVAPGKGNALRVKWKVSYRMGSTGAVLSQETGVLERLPAM